MGDITSVVQEPVSAQPLVAMVHTRSPERLGEDGTRAPHRGRNHPWQCGGGGDGNSGHSACTSSTPRGKHGHHGGQGRQVIV